MSSIADRAKAFEALCPRRTRSVNGQEWTYYLGGTGEPLLLLTGGAGIGIAWADLVVALPERYRILAIDYPAIPSFIGLADGLNELLAAEDFGQAHVVAQSMGSMLAEFFSRQAPERVRSMVLTGAGLYGVEDRARLEGKLKMMESTPWEEMRESIRQSLRSTWADSPDAEFWIAEIDRINAGEIGRARTLAPYSAMIESIDRLPALQAEPAWSGPVLFVRGEDDPLITRAHYEHLLAMHPQAELRSYETGGHSLLLTRPQDYVRDIEAFFAQQR